ncbi:alcohol oxidase 1 [Meredithblackwellia eburnea MCA 4105]
MSFPEEVDVIIVGGGTAGCVVAGRLASQFPKLQFAIIEAGQDNLDRPSVVQPADFPVHIAPGSATSEFYKSKASKHVADRESIVPTGAILGGGGSVNFMMYTRALSSDYDDWKQEGWTFKDILPLAIKMESNKIPKGQVEAVHGFNGPLEVSYGGHQSWLGHEFVQSAKACWNVPFTLDLQDFSTGHGVSRWAKWISPTTGRRQDTAHAYVHPVHSRSRNLHLLTSQKTIRVIFEGTRAVGIEYMANPYATVENTWSGVHPTPKDPPRVMKARKMVVISAGAFGTPAVLERSGVGCPEVLQKVEIDVVVDLPGVGKEYQDHQITHPSYFVSEDADTLDEFYRQNPSDVLKADSDWLNNRTGVVASNGIDAGMKARPNETELAEMGEAFQKVWADFFANRPDKPVMACGIVAGFPGDHSALPRGRFMSLGNSLMYPLSKGSLHISAKDPFAAPDFDAGYLNHPADLSPQVWMYKKTREVCRRMPSYRGEVEEFHPSYPRGSEARCQTFSEPPPSADIMKDLVYSAEDNLAVESWVRENVKTSWHSIATCPMKARAAGGVVDARLNVYGTTALKLADLSICPSNLGTNTFSVAVTIGERAAEIFVQDLHALSAPVAHL